MLRPAATLLALALVAGACTGPSEVERRAAEVERELPDDWHTDVIEDDEVGRFLVSSPSGTVTWTLGEELEELEAATEGSAWAEFWLPQLRAASSDDSNVRVVVADSTTLRGEVVSWIVNVAPLDPDLPTDNAAALAVEWSNRFLAQGLTVRQTTVTEWADGNLASVAFEVPAEVFAGESRYVRQWYVVQPGSDRLWSFVCDGPADPVASQPVCRDALDGFRPSPSPPARTG
jgi:hypothetical protein